MGRSTDNIILSHNDAILRQSDLDILSGPEFLNDRIIEFYFSYLSSFHHHPSEEVLLVSPSISFWILNCPDKDSLGDFLAPLKLADKKLVIFPVNNNDDVTVAEGGSHWSVLIFHRNARVFVHHDSYGGFNNVHARNLHSNVYSHMGISSKYLVAETPQQMNGYDCGIYVCAITRTVIEWFYSNVIPVKLTDLWLYVVSEQVTPSVTSNMRKEILELVQCLMFEKKQEE
ncbi:NEDD8-specific protease 1 [Impatiens glandulifera]|uniref:NEDD8-specific protease 1 n=1 Tax=Impatiens glandulifera TaxID=253017 RepID=UPI001FB07D54|nr:NEDD8-specific protease 1 [Impatiens glandulifera]